MKQRQFIFTALLFALFTTPILTLAANNSSLGSGITVSEATELLTGIVKDADGKALPGATIKKAGNTNGFTSDKNGEFRALGIKRGENLEISAKGYKTKRIKAAPNMEIRLEKEEPATATQEKKNEVAAPATTTPVPTSSSANTITVSGTVSDNSDVIPGANIVPIDSDGTKIPNIGTTTDINGYFELKIPADTQLRVSYTGYGTEIIQNPGQNLNIKLTVTPTEMTEVEVGVCSRNNLEQKYDELINQYNATDLKWDTSINKCIAKTCKNTTDIIDEKTGYCIPDCNMTQNQPNNADTAHWDYTKNLCVPTACITGYKLNNYACEPIVCDADAGLTLQGNDCVKTDCSQSDIAKFENATGGKMENGQCIPICATDYGLNKENKCVKNECTEQQKSDLFATAGIIENGKCVPTACVDDYELDKDAGKCSQKSCPTKELEKLRATAGYMKDGKCIPTACITDYKLEKGACVNADILAEKQKAYDEAHEKEQSFANRTLTALTTAATGIGGMELARGLAEQSADKDAAADMAAYIATFRCNYGDGKQFTAGPDEIELPGGNNQEMMNLRAQYLALAADLKERKTALGMKPGIESEEIGDKTQTGLYDDESIGITSGNYASLYRATALGSESDQAQIDDAAAASKRRVIGGAVAAGAGVVGGFVGNELINGELGKKLKEKNQGKALRAAVEIEKDALDDMKKCLKNAGVTDTDSLEFQNFYISVLSVKNINCKREITEIATKAPSNVAAKTIFADSNDANTIYDQLIKSFGPTIAGKMIGVTLSQTPTESQKQNAINTLKSGLDKVTKRFQDAAKEDEKRLSSSGLKDFDIDFSSILSSFSGDGASSSIMNVVNNVFK